MPSTDGVERFESVTAQLAEKRREIWINLCTCTSTSITVENRKILETEACIIDRVCDVFGKDCTIELIIVSIMGASEGRVNVLVSDFSTLGDDSPIFAETESWCDQREFPEQLPHVDSLL